MRNNLGIIQTMARKTETYVYVLGSSKILLLYKEICLNVHKQSYASQNESKRRHIFIYSLIPLTQQLYFL